MVGIFPPPSRQFPQLAVCEELVAFYSDLSHNLDEGLNCLHFHRLKQEELCILLRGYYSLEDLYILLKSVIGSSDNFKDFVLENYQHVNDVSDFALLAHMSVIFSVNSKKNLSGRYASGSTNVVPNVSCVIFGILIKALRKLLQAMVLPLHPISRYSANNILV